MGRNSRLSVVETYVSGRVSFRLANSPDVCCPLRPASILRRESGAPSRKLLMLDAEMQIVDLRPSGFFDFSLDRYHEQLVAGYERTLPDMGLEVYMLGLDKLGSGRGRQHRLP